VRSLLPQGRPPLLRLLNKMASNANQAMTASEE